MNKRQLIDAFRPNIEAKYGEFGLMIAHTLMNEGEMAILDLAQKIDEQLDRMENQGKLGEGS